MTAAHPHVTGWGGVRDREVRHPGRVTAVVRDQDLPASDTPPAKHILELSFPACSASANEALASRRYIKCLGGLRTLGTLRIR
jgi:hypothetical protein